jgi:methionyl-tRNA formyltransferase
MKVTFFGTSDRSIPILESLKRSCELVLIVTKEDVRFGRRQVLKETEVKRWAKKNKIKFLTISSLKENDLSQVIEHIKSSKSDFGLVCDFSFIIPQELINEFKGSLINIHFSLLPKYRGASPVQFAILNGDKTTGIIFQKIAEKVDSGDVLQQYEYKIDANYTSGQLYEKLFNFAGEKLPEFMTNYETGKLEAHEQDESQATYTYSRSHPKHTYIYKEDALINWEMPANTIEQQIRAFNPWPIAWTYLKDMEKAENLAAGKIVFKKHVDKNLSVKIYVAKLVSEKLEVQQLQIEGKNKLAWKEFENGYLIK